MTAAPPQARTAAGARPAGRTRGRRALLPPPLWRRAPVRLLRSGLWGPLVLVAFLLLGTAAAGAPLFSTAAGDVAWRETVATVREGAPASEAPVVRLNGGQAPEEEEQARLLARLRAVPGMTDPTVVGGSIGVEVAPPGLNPRPFVAVGDRTVPARLYGDADLSGALVPAPGSPGPTDVPDGVWLSAPTAEELGVGPGDPVEVGVQYPDLVLRSPTRVAGVYAVGIDRRRPADVPGDARWSARGGQLPRDAERTLVASLLVTDPATLVRLAREVGDPLFWTAESRLASDSPSLVEVERAAAGIRVLEAAVTDPEQVGFDSGPLRVGSVSGLPDLAARAREIRDATVDRTTTLAWASVGLGLLAVGAVAVLGMARRRVELALGAGLGVAPRTTAAQAGLEVLPAALLGAAVGPAAALAVLAAVDLGLDDPGPVLGASVTNAAQAVLVGVLVVSLVAGVAAALAARPEQGRSDRRRLPWDLLLGVVAATAVLGLTSRETTGTPGWLDLLVPVLVAAAVGALGGRLLGLVLTGLAARRRSRAPRSRARATAWLALRRLAAPADARLLVLTLLTTGLALQMYSVSADDAVRDVTADRAAVIAGAQAVARVDGSWQLDEDPVPLPDRSELDPGAPPIPLAVGRTPPLPPGAAAVWRRTTVVPNRFGDVELMVVDPPSFLSAAAWGRGPDLAAARAMLVQLAGDEQQRTEQQEQGSPSGPLLGIAVGDTGLQVGQRASVTTGSQTVGFEVLGTVPVWPGSDPLRPSMIVTGTNLLLALGEADPRLLPLPERNPPPPEFRAQLWSADGQAGLQAVLQPLGVDPRSTSTLADAEQRPELVSARRGLGYQLALGACVAAVAVLALSLYADRAAARGRAADLLLRRTGLGRGGPVVARALELALVGVVALVLALVAVALVTPLGARLLDGGQGTVPALAFGPTPPAVALTALTAAVAVLAAVAVTVVRGRTGTDGSVLRDAE